jgi:hypothetical protein
MPVNKRMVLVRHLALVPLPNPDKHKHESYKKGDNPCKISKTVSVLFLGGVNSKSYQAKHIILHIKPKKPKFTEVHIFMDVIIQPNMMT